MKIVVTVKQVPATGADKRYTDDLRLDRASVEAIINPLDEYAIEQALRLLDAGTDESVTARVLAAALDKLEPDVALMGMASDDARGSLVPGAVAAMRNVPLLSYGSELTLGDGVARVRRLTATGF